MANNKVAYVTGGMGGIGTAICQRLHKEGFTVIAGCGPSRDFTKWLDEQKALGYTFYASVGNVADWNSTVGGSWAGKFADGSVTIDATPGDLHMHTSATMKLDAPTKIHIKSTEVKIDADSSWAERHKIKNEWYVEKGAIGVLKIDEAAISQGYTGLKLDTVSVAPCWTLMLAFAQASQPGLTTLGPQWNAARSTHFSIRPSCPGRGRRGA